MRTAILLGAALALASCATIAESRVKSALVDAGLGDENATCMADRMVDRLTIAQLRKLEELRTPSHSAREASLQDYLERVRRVGDAEVIAVTTSSAALCASGLAR
ncbi:MAG: hypothetical protein JY451_00165 [Erythrobacter sp.]|nr:MAG: hypothetical protein JY451_00165 [Erythrobacter sp.]